MNTLGTTAGKVIAQEALKTLLVRFPALKEISTDFSAYRAKFNQPVVTSIVTAQTAQDYDTTNGYLAGAVAQTDVNVVIDNHKHVTFQINDQERSASVVDLVQRFAPTAAHALGKSMMDVINATVTEANFPNHSLYTASNFNRAALVACGNKLNKRFAYGPGRFAVLASDHYANLVTDASVVTLSNLFSLSNEVANSAVLPPMFGYDSISAYDALVDPDAKGLAGFAATRQALCLATRLPDEPAVTEGGIMEVVTEPNSGLSVLLRNWYNWQLGQENYTLTLMFGVAKGSVQALERISLSESN